MRDAFRRVTGLEPLSLDQVRIMRTRRLPVPFFEGTEKFIQFAARLQTDGLWAIEGLHNFKSTTNGGIQLVADAYTKAAKRHNNGMVNESMRFNLDTALLILRDIEQDLTKSAQIHTKKLPKNHFSVAYALLPPTFREGIDEIAAKRSGKDVNFGQNNQKSTPGGTKPPQSPMN